jgi:transposase
MGRAYGIDLRARVVEAIEIGLSHRQAAGRFCVAVSTAGNWHRLWRRTGSTRPGKQGHPVGSKLDAYEAEILAMVEENKDIALYEIAERLAGQHGVRAAPSTVWHFFQKRSITFKKRPRTPPSRSVRTF